MRSNKPILVTGSHRSGSTWVGQMIAEADNVGYIYEPFNINLQFNANSKPFEKWFALIDDENSQVYYKVFNDILKFKFPFFRNLRNVKSFRDFRVLLEHQRTFSINRISAKRPLLKDPVAFFSAEWLFNNFDLEVIVLIRHPAAFCSSLKVLNWRFDFVQLVQQPNLIDNYLCDYKDQIIEFSKKEMGIVDQGILVWNCFHSVIAGFMERYPSWIYLKHEDLSSNPHEQFKHLFERLGLNYTDAVHSAIEDSTGSHNPAEKVKGNIFKRDSKRNIYNWKTRLTASEIETIKANTEQLFNYFYPDYEW